MTHPPILQCLIKPCLFSPHRIGLLLTVLLLLVVTSCKKKENKAPQNVNEEAQTRFTQIEHNLYDSALVYPQILANKRQALQAHAYTEVLRNMAYQSLIFQMQGESDSINHVFRQADSLKDLTQDSLGYAFYEYIAARRYLYFRKNDYASEHGLNAMRLFKKYPETFWQYQTASLLSFVCALHFKTNYTLLYKNEMKTLLQKLNNPLFTADYYLLIANEYNLEGKKDSACPYYNQSMLYAKQSKSPAQMTKIAANIFVIEHCLPAHLSMTQYLDSIAQVSKEKGLKRIYTATLANLSTAYITKKEYQKAIDVGYIAYLYAEKYNYPDLKRVTCLHLANANRGLGNFEKGLQYMDAYAAYGDSLNALDKNETILEMKLKYDVQKQKDVIQMREVEIYKQKRELIVIFGLGFVLLIGIVALALAYVRLKDSKKIIEENHQTIEKNNEELRQLHTIKDRIFSIISHDLRNPLQSLKQFIGLTRKGHLIINEERIVQMEKLVENAHNTAENLLNWANSQFYGDSHNPTAVNLQALIEDMVDNHEAMAQRKEITIKVDCPDDVQVHVDIEQMRIVIRNLLSNAMKFTPRLGTVSCNVHVGKTDAHVAISDTGVGIDPNIIPQLFNPPGQKPHTVGTEGEKGTGLGLRLCKEFIEKNNGRIWVTSQKEKGSTFTFSMPLLSGAM